MVKRWEVKGWNNDQIEVEDEDGQWVLYSDYAVMVEQLTKKGSLPPLAKATDAGNPVAWRYRWKYLTPSETLTHTEWAVTVSEYDAQVHKLEGFEVQPLYTHPTPEPDELDPETVERCAKECDRIDDECGMEAGLAGACATAIRSLTRLQP